MRKPQCDRQAEVLQAAGRGRCHDELREHIAGCDGCRDLLEVAAAVVEDRGALMREARLPGSGLVWWRANLRARQDAARIALRTARLVQVALLVLAMVIALALIGTNISSVDFRGVVASVMSALGHFALPLVALAAWLILAPVAVYFAVTEE